MSPSLPPYRLVAVRGSEPAAVTSSTTAASARSLPNGVANNGLASSSTASLRWQQSSSQSRVIGGGSSSKKKQQQHAVKSGAKKVPHRKKKVSKKSSMSSSSQSSHVSGRHRQHSLMSVDSGANTDVMSQTGTELDLSEFENVDEMAAIDEEDCDDEHGLLSLSAAHSKPVTAVRRVHNERSNDGVEYYSIQRL